MLKKIDWLIVKSVYMFKANKLTDSKISLDVKSE